jgi:hypothetical protein
VKFSLALIVLLAAAAPAFAQTDSDTNGTGISHGFAVSDGDTVKFGKQRVRLFGIDAPEKGQPCDDGHWYPGPLATKALVDFIAGRPVSCHQVDYDWKNSRPRRDLLCWQGRLPGADGKCRLGVGLYRLQRPVCRRRETGGSARRRRSRASLYAALGVAGVKAG